MEEFLRYVIRHLAEHPDEVVITRTESPSGVVFHLAARSSDVPRIVGRNGHTLRALRTLLAASAAKRGQSANLVVLDS